MGVISAIFGWINWVFRSHFRGLKWIVIWFIPLFFYYAWFCLFWAVFVNFNFASHKHDIRRCFWGLEDQRRKLKAAQNNPTRTHRSKYRGQGRPNNEATKWNKECTGQPPPRVARVVYHGPWWEWHGRAIWHAWPCVSFCSRFALFFHALLFSCAVFQFVCCERFAKDEDWRKRRRIEPASKGSSKAT